MGFGLLLLSGNGAVNVLDHRNQFFQSGGAFIEDGLTGGFCIALIHFIHHFSSNLEPIFKSGLILIGQAIGCTVGFFENSDLLGDGFHAGIDVFLQFGNSCGVIGQQHFPQISCGHIGFDAAGFHGAFCIQNLVDQGIGVIAGVDEADDAQGRDDAGQQDHDTKRGEQIGLEFHFVKHMDSPL